MNILVCIGSYRTRGNTARLVELVVEELRAEARQVDEDLIVETTFLGHQDLQFCRGCRICFDKGETLCPLHDDLLLIKDKMLAADGLIVATPVYVNDVNGITKNWIDRLAHVCHRPQFAGRSVYFIATVGDSPTRHALRTLQVAFQTWGCHIVGQTGFKTGARMPDDELRQRFHVEAARIARTFFAAIHQRHDTNPSFLELMIFRIQQISWAKAAGDTLDYRYWQAQGWLEPSCEYYLPHRANRLKVFLARLTGAAITPFVA